MGSWNWVGDTGMKTAVLHTLDAYVGQTYLLPLFKYPLAASPPHTIISLPVHTAVCACRAIGALTVLVAAQTSAHVPSHFKAVVILGRM